MTDSKRKGKFNAQAENFFTDLRSFGTQIITHTTNLDEQTANQIAGELANRLASIGAVLCFMLPNTTLGNTTRGIWRFGKRLRSIIILSWCKNLICRCPIFMKS